MQQLRSRFPWLIPAGILVVVLGLYAAGGFFGVPALIDSQARKFVRANFDRELSLGQVRFNPFTLTLEVEQLRIPDADGGPLLGFKHLLINVDSNSLWRRALSFQAIALDDLVIDAVVRPGGALNLADLQVKSPDAAPAVADQPLPRIVIDDLQVNNGQVHFEDRNRPAPFVTTVSPVTFRMANFSTYRDGEHYELDAHLFESGRLTWRGSLTAQPLTSQGEFSLGGIPLSRVDDFLGDALPVTLSSGVAALHGRYHLSPDDFTIDDGQVAVTALAVRPRGGDVDYLGLDKVVASGLKLTLVGRQAEVGRLKLDGGQVQAWLSPAGELNLAALAGPASAKPSAESPSAEAPPQAAEHSTNGKAWEVRVPDIELDNFAVHVEDRSLKPAAALVLQPLQLGIKGFSTAPGAVIESRLVTTINSTGKATVAASTALDSLASTADIEMTELPLDMLQPYIADQTSMTLTSGTLTVKGKAAYAGAADTADTAKPKPRISFDGDVAIQGLRTIDNALHDDFVKWERLGIRGIHYQSAPQAVRIEAIDLHKPYARLIIAPDGTSNLTAILAGPGATAVPAPGPTLVPPADQQNTPAPAAVVKAPAAASSNAVPFPVRIGVISIENGSARFADLTTQPNFDIGLQKLKGTITGLSSAAGSRAKVVIDGQVDEFSPVTIRGAINPLAAKTFLDMSMTLRNVELASFTPYSGRFAGYSIQQGKLSADLGYQVQDRQLNADHKFVINQFQLGDKVDSPDATSLPLKLAVALLKDRNGVIDLDLPVTGNIDDPKFRIGPIIWKVFVNLITKAATAPFALLGNMVGGGEDLNLIGFAPGKATLDGEDLTRIGSLAKALTERPGLQLSVPATYNRAADLPALQEAAFEERVVRFGKSELAARKQPAADLDYATIISDPVAYQKMLESIYRTDYGQKFTPPKPPPGEQTDDNPAPVIPLLESAIRERQSVDDNALFALARARAVAVQELLLTDTGVDPGRVFLTAPAEGATGDAGVVLELKLR